MLYWLSAGEFKYITDFEWLTALKLYPLVIQLAEGQGHFLNRTRHLKYLDREERGICGLKFILSCFGTKLVLHDI